MVFATPFRAVRVLPVEDEAFVAELRADIVACEGYEVEWAENGRLALEKIDGRPSDFILRDLRMPELDGMGLDRELEQRPSGLMRRLIVVTGTTEPPDSRSVLVHADVPVLAKPCTRVDVQDLTRLVLTTSRPWAA